MLCSTCILIRWIEKAEMADTGGVLCVCVKFFSALGGIGIGHSLAAGIAIAWPILAMQRHCFKKAKNLPRGLKMFYFSVFDCFCTGMSHHPLLHSILDSCLHFSCLKVLDADRVFKFFGSQVITDGPKIGHHECFGVIDEQSPFCLVFDHNYTSEQMCPCILKMSYSFIQH